MKTIHLTWEEEQGWHAQGEAQDVNPQLIIFFGGYDNAFSAKRYQELATMFPGIHIIGGTTAGEISGDEVLDGGAVAVALEFEKTRIKGTSVSIADETSVNDQQSQSYLAGLQLGGYLNEPDLRSIFILSDGHQVNGSELVKGLTDSVPEDVVITGGLAGDGGKFEETGVGFNGPPEPGIIGAIGFYGEAFRIGHGSVGGWDPFGPKRNITKATSNVLYELDGKPALELYKSYLGDAAEQLPGSALQFPLMIKPSGQEGVGTVRTILGVDEEQQSLTFAGDMPEGYEAQLMMASFEHLVDGAGSAAQSAFNSEASQTQGEKLAILVSCVGRKMVLGQRIEDEVEIVSDTLNQDAPQIGFYSYGEISPHSDSGFCDLHNQTMTVTYISESV